ncbi:MAG: SpoVR family protein [Deltaproteobacteria bacterium]|nr:SpoVR family protein [Deltaproteobacteria bacterium]
MGLPLHLWKIKEEVLGHARDFGLEPFETIFEMVDYRTINEIASLGGFPVRYPHWRFGMEYERMSKSDMYGLHKIYEMVINNDPCYAYLQEGNTLLDQKLIFAHVYGHSDFFRNNLWFAHTNRKMMDEMANHAARVRTYVDRHGLATVERFLDRCLSIDNLIDPFHPEGPRRSRADGEEDRPVEPRRIQGPSYMEKYLNPEPYLEAQKQKLAREREALRRIPSHPERDIMGFLLEHAPLEPWERTLLGIVREEALYFSPQSMTKIMNEGWASYWHSRILTEKALDSSEVVDFADRHSGTMAMSGRSLNPYKLGLELFRDIEERWDRGRFGKEWEECDDLREKNAWDRDLGLGRARIFEVRRIYNDVSFIDEFLTRDFCVRHRLFTWAWKERSGDIVLESRDFDAIKAQLLDQLTNYGQPVIEVLDGNAGNRGELLLRQRDPGRDLDKTWGRDVLGNIAAIWRRPVALQATEEGREELWSHDGERFLVSPASPATKR